MAESRRVVYGRINRRSIQEPLYNVRPVREELRALAESKRTAAEVDGVPWYAGDFSFDPAGDFVTGILGFSERERFQEFDEAAWSWLKGAVHEPEGASARTKVPFAIDLRESMRWVAFAPTYRIRAAGFSRGFAIVLNTALNRIGRTPSEWEVDLVVEVTQVETWLDQHQNVVKFTRTVKYHNPVDNLDDERAEMRAINAQTKTESFSSGGRGRSLATNTQNPEFVRKLEGLATGDVDVYLEAREGSTKATFSSKNHFDYEFVEDFGDNLELGMELMLRAVSEYSERAGGQGELL
jgi:hypothetical protein